MLESPSARLLDLKPALGMQVDPVTYRNANHPSMSNMCVDTSIDMRTDVCARMCEDMRTDMRIGVCMKRV